LPAPAGKRYHSSPARINFDERNNSKPTTVMNPVHLHLPFNHVSILAVLFSSLIFAWGLLSKDQSIQRVALVGFVFAALATLPVFLSGEETEEVVEEISYVSESMIDEHEDGANYAFWLVELLGLLALIRLLLAAKMEKWMRASSLVLVFLSVMATTAMIRVGYLGGQIRHTEINSAPATNQDSPAEESNEAQD
jgi:hypothetical protein